MFHIRKMKNVQKMEVFMQIECFFNYCDSEPEVLSLETNKGNLLIGLGDCSKDDERLMSEEASVYGDLLDEYDSETEGLANIQITDVQDDMEFGVSYNRIVCTDESGILTIRINDDGCGNRKVNVVYNRLSADAKRDVEEEEINASMHNNSESLNVAEQEQHGQHREYGKSPEEYDSTKVAIYASEEGGVIKLPTDILENFSPDKENNGYSESEYPPDEQEEMLQLAIAASESPSVAEKMKQYEMSQLKSAEKNKQAEAVR